MKLNLAKLVSETGKIAGKYLPEILAGIGVSGVILTAIETGKATKKATKVIEEAEKESKKDLTTKEKVKLTWKYYISTGIIVVITGTAIVGSNVISSKRYSALSTLLLLTDKAAKEGQMYELKAKEALGKEKHEEIKKEIKKETINDLDDFSTEKYGLSGDEVLTFVEKVTGQKFKSSINKLNQIRLDISERILTENFVLLDYFIDEVGMNSASTSEIHGWTTDDLVHGVIVFDYLPVFDAKMGYKPIVIDTSARPLDENEMY